MEVHGTVHGTSTVHVPSYVKNHGILSGRDLQFLLRETKVSPLQMFHIRSDLHICTSVEAACFCWGPRFYVECLCWTTANAANPPGFSRENTPKTVPSFSAYSSQRGRISNLSSVSWRWEVSLALALKDGVLLTPVMSASWEEKGESVSISLTSETRSFPIKPGTEGRQRTEPSDRSLGSGRKQSHRSWFRLLVKTRQGES